jgi:hypothetical protein
MRFSKQGPGIVIIKGLYPIASQPSSIYHPDLHDISDISNRLFCGFQVRRTFFRTPATVSSTLLIFFFLLTSNETQSSIRVYCLCWVIVSLVNPNKNRIDYYCGKMKGPSYATIDAHVICCRLHHSNNATYSVGLKSGMHVHN